MASRIDDRPESRQWRKWPRTPSRRVARRAHAQEIRGKLEFVEIGQRPVHVAINLGKLRTAAQQRLGQLDQIELPKALLRRSPELAEVYRDMNRPLPDFDELKFSADFLGVCAPRDPP